MNINAKLMSLQMSADFAKYQATSLQEQNW